MTRPLRLKKPDPNVKPKKPKARVLSAFDLMERFPDEGAAIAYLQRMRLAAVVATHRALKIYSKK